MKIFAAALLLASVSGQALAADLAGIRDQLPALGAQPFAAIAPTAPLPAPVLSPAAGRSGQGADYAPALEVVRGFRLYNLAVDIQGGEVLRQAAAFKSRVSAEKAVALALESFLNDFEDPDSPLSLTLQTLAVEGAGSQKVFLVQRARERLFSMLNREEAELRLAAAGKKAGRGEEVSGNWIFSLKLPAFSGYTHWAVVNRASGKVYNYGVRERGGEKAEK